MRNRSSCASGSGIGALELDRVLGRDHHERSRQAVGVRVDGDLALLHRLEQRRLRLGRGPVDLVGEHDVGEHAAGAELELVRRCGSTPTRRVTSDGRRSGVNWMRWQVPPIDAAMALASEVLPTPGTSSMRRWPSASRHTRARWTGSALALDHAARRCRAAPGTSGRTTNRGSARWRAEPRTPPERARDGTRGPRAFRARPGRLATVRSHGARAAGRVVPARRSGLRAVVLVLRAPAPVARPRCARPLGSPAAGGGAARRSCPLPDPDYLRFRLETQYGAGGRPDPRDLVAYLEWCRRDVERSRCPEAGDARQRTRPDRPRNRAGRLPRRPDPRVEVATLGKSAAAQRQLRAALRRADAPGGRPRAEGEGRDRRAQRRRAPLRAGARCPCRR